MKILMNIFWMLILTIAFSGCQDQSKPSLTPTNNIPKLASINPHIRGSIKEIRIYENRIIGLYVVGKKETDTAYDQAIVGITDVTKIYIIENNQYKILSSDNLKVGQNVEIHFTGSIGESYPVQADADEILIIP